MVTLRTCVIFNPASKGGKTGKKIDKILKAIKYYLGKEYNLLISSKPHEATTLCRNAIKNGVELIISIGGDGTIQEVVNGFFNNGSLINSECKLGIVSSGTGQGFAQSLGLPKELNEQLRIINSEHYQSIDLGKALFSNNGKSTERYFVNEFQVGIGGAVCKRLKNNQKLFGGFFAFGVTTICTLFSHPNQQVSLVSQGHNRFTSNFLGIVIANGAFTGGGMNLAPKAKLDDGLLDVLLIHELSLTERLEVFPKIYTGEHLTNQKLDYFKTKHLKIESSEDVLLAADGESLGHLPCTIDILPSAIKVCTQ